MVLMTRNDYDVWNCECTPGVMHMWTTPSVPHNSKCPQCGKHGWWQRFEYGKNYTVDVDTTQFEYGN